MFTAGEDDPPCFCLSRVPSVKLGFGICYDLEVIFLFCVLRVAARF